MFKTVPADFDGQFEKLPGQRGFLCQPGLDLVVDSEDRIIALDPSILKLRIFELK